MTGSKKKRAAKRQGRRKGRSDEKLDGMIKDAIVDAHDEFEQTVGFHNLLEENLAVPFQTEMLGFAVTVEQIEMSDDGQIVAVCSRGKSRQRVPILDLPLPSPPPQGADWIDAYRRWARGGR